MTWLANSSRAAWPSACTARAVPRAASSAARFLPKKSSSQLADSWAFPILTTLPASGGGTRPLAEKRWRVASSWPLTCGSSAARLTSAAACARAQRAWVTFRLGLLSSARVTSVLSCSSPNARHQSVARGIGEVAVLSPTDSALRIVAIGLMPDRSAQPVKPVAIRAVAATLATLMTAMRREARHIGSTGGSPARFTQSDGSASVREATRGAVQEGQEVRKVMVSHQSVRLRVFCGLGWLAQRCP